MADKSLKWLMEIAKLARLKLQIKELKKPVDRATAKEAGEELRDGMREFVSKGVSPVREVGRFPAYKNKLKYPGDLKGARPVNLKLTGGFQDALTYRIDSVSSGYAPTMFYKGDDENGVDYDDYESGHREGVNGQPSRPTIPRHPEQFAVTLTRRVKNIFNARIRELTQRKK